MVLSLLTISAPTVSRKRWHHAYGLYFCTILRSCLVDSCVLSKVKVSKKGLVEVKKEEAFRIRGRKKKLYGLTFRGVIQSLKIGVKLPLIQNSNELITSWINRANKFESVLKIRQKFKMKEDFKKVENLLLRYLKRHPESIESFLKHYDLDFFDEHLVFIELVNYVYQHELVSSIPINREIRRQLDRLPESLKIYSVIPQLWKVEKEVKN